MKVTKSLPETMALINKLTNSKLNNYILNYLNVCICIEGLYKKIEAMFMHTFYIILLFLNILSTY